VFTTEAEVRDFVERTYEKVRGRGLDKDTADYYVGQLLGGKIAAADFANLLRESPGFKDAYPDGAVPKKPVLPEVIPVQVPTDIKVNLTEEIITKVIVQSRTYTERIKPTMDVGRYIQENVSSEFWRVFYEQREAGSLTFELFCKMLASYNAIKEMEGK